VAKIDRIERRADTAFARIHCVPAAHVTAARYVLVLAPTGVLQARAAATESALSAKKAGDKAAAKPGDKPSAKPGAKPDRKERPAR
jgi:rod shape-determining protein MreC